MQALTYRLFDGCSLDDLEEKDRYYLSDEYKRTVLQHMSVPQLIDTILINPTVNVSPSYRDTGARLAPPTPPLHLLQGGGSCTCKLLPCCYRAGWISNHPTLPCVYCPQA